ncbi:MAG TPA: hypothetical protein PKC30_09200 [Saprospiraceae bacterium]|nr:hypothetical protein [Saprospiraceae bacterium]
MRLSYPLLFFSITLFLFCLILSSPIQAQEDYPIGSVITITLQNGQKISGELISKTDREIRMKKGKEITRIPIANIAYMSQSETGIEPEIAYLQDRYFLFSSAIPMDKGDIYYRNMNVFFNAFSIGVTSNFSIAGGFETLTLLAGEFPTVFIAPKFNVPVTKNVYLGVNSISYFRSEFFVSALFGNATIGNESYNINLGIGFGIDGIESVSSAFYTLSGIAKISNKVSLMAELISVDAFNDFFSSFVSLNARIKLRGDIFLDVGFIRIGEFDGTFNLPTVGIALPISKSN